MVAAMAAFRESVAIGMCATMVGPRNDLVGRPVTFGADHHRGTLALDLTYA